MTTDNATVPPTSGLPWRCFHCDETFTDRRAARDHFGACETGMAACVQVLTETEKAIVEDRREWRDRALRAEAEGEQLGFELNQYRWGLLKGWKGDHSPADIRNMFDSLEGELLAARAQAQPAQAAFLFGYDAGTSDAERVQDGGEALGVTHWWSLQADRVPDAAASRLMHTNSVMARDTLARIEIAHGEWTAYGFDGRMTTDAIETVDQEAAGCGYRARFVDNPHGRDYGWGPLGQIEAAAVAFFLAEHLAAVADE